MRGLLKTYYMKKHNIASTSPRKIDLGGTLGGVSRQEEINALNSKHSEPYTRKNS